MSNNQVQTIITIIFTIKIIEVFATLHDTLPKQYVFVFSIFSKIITKIERIEITKKINAGVHKERTLFKTSMIIIVLSSVLL